MRFYFRDPEHELLPFDEYNQVGLLQGLKEGGGPWRGERGRERVTDRETETERQRQRKGERERERERE